MFFTSPHKVLDWQYLNRSSFETVSQTCSLGRVMEKLPRFSLSLNWKKIFSKQSWVITDQWGTVWNMQVLSSETDQEHLGCISTTKNICVHAVLFQTENSDTSGKGKREGTRAERWKHQVWHIVWNVSTGFKEIAEATLLDKRLSCFLSLFQGLDLWNSIVMEKDFQRETSQSRCICATIMIQVAKLSWVNISTTSPLVPFWQQHKENKYIGIESSLTDAED